MNASRPEAETEYSTRSQRSRGVSGRRAASPAGRRGLVAALCAVGAIVLLVAEFSRLLTIRTVAAHPRVAHTVATGPHHDWALLPIALLALAMGLLVWRSGARLGLVAIAVLGLAALGVAIGVDLPDAHATGLVGTPQTGLTEAQAHAAAGLYLETLGAVVLLAAGVAGLLLAAGGTHDARRVSARPRRSRPASPPR